MILEKILVWLLVVGILPSITAPFTFLQDFTLGQGFHPFVWLGPVNFLKIFFWVPLLFLFKKRSQVNTKWALALAAVLLVGTCATIISASRCSPLPVQDFKEWAVIVISCIFVFSFFLLSPTNRRLVTVSWLVILFGLTFLDTVFPKATEYMVEHWFHPMALSDMSELGYRALASIWGRQSLAKLLCFVPWIWFCFHRKLNWLSISVLLLALPLTAATTQRGPVVAEVAALLVFMICYFGSRLFHFRGLALLALATFILAVGAIIIVPRQVWEPRLASFYMAEIPKEKIGITAWESSFANRNARMRMLRFSSKIIAENPLGNACIPLETFHEAGLDQPRSSHNLFLEQYRERGWIWGTLHLLLWIFSTVVAFRGVIRFERSVQLSALACVWVAGLFDHAWQVLNHGLFLWVILLLPFARFLLLTQGIASAKKVPSK